MHLLIRIRLLSALWVLLVAACNKQSSSAEQTSTIPKEFQGDWVFDEKSAIAAIQAMSVDDETKSKLMSSYIGMIRGETRHVDSTGRITGPSYPDSLTIRLNRVEERDDGIITNISNSMNPEAKQFTLNTIVDGVWRSQLLDESLNPVSGVPDDYWKRPDADPID